MKIIFYLKGIPASGKSTWANEQMRKYPNRFKRINKDLLREMLNFSKFDVQKEKFLLNVRDYIIRLSLKKGFDIIVDDTNFSDKHWYRIAEIAKEVGDVKIIEKYFDVNYKEAIKRNSTRKNPLPESVISNMFKKHVKGKKIEHREEYYPLSLKPDFIEGLPRVIIVDIDGTIAFNDGHRDYFDYTKVLNDSPIDEIIELIQIYKQEGFGIVLVSGREESCREDTELWIHNYGIDYNDLYMRENDDRRQDYIIKNEIYENYLKGKYNIKFVLDDRNQVVNMWRELGLKVLQVSDGTF